MIKKSSEGIKINHEDIICLNFESKTKYEDWMSIIIDIKRKFGDENSLRDSMQLALKLGIKAKSLSEDDSDSNTSEDKNKYIN